MSISGTPRHSTPSHPPKSTPEVRSSCTCTSPGRWCSTSQPKMRCCPQTETRHSGSSLKVSEISIRGGRHQMATHGGGGEYGGHVSSTQTVKSTVHTNLSPHTRVVDEDVDSQPRPSLGYNLGQSGDLRAGKQLGISWMLESDGNELGVNWESLGCQLGVSWCQLGVSRMVESGSSVRHTVRHQTDV